MALCPCESQGYLLRARCGGPHSALLFPSAPVRLRQSTWRYGCPCVQSEYSRRKSLIGVITISGDYNNGLVSRLRERGVGMGGLEPPWISPHDPKSCAYTNSATSPVAEELYVNSVALAIPKFVGMFSLVCRVG